MPEEKNDPDQTREVSDSSTYQMDSLAEPLTIEGRHQQDEALWPAANWDRYELVSLLGQGGMGRVFKAYDPRLRRHVALKFILGESPDHARRFIREAQTQARVEHENVCKIYEVSHVQDKPYIAMQYLEGRTLTALIKEMTLEEKVSVMRDVCQGIHAAHRLGLIHRDIKPGNVMVERRDHGWHPYVMDFGLARPMDSAELTQVGLVMGTPAYMSPEQASGNRDLDRRSDVYSLGATLYSIVSGRPPFEGSSPMEVLSNIATKEPPALLHRDRQVPRELETIIFKCLEKDPAHRYDSARALADDLQRFLDGDPIQASPPSLGYRIGKKIRKNPRAFGVAAAAVAAAIVFGGFAVQSRWSAQERADAARQFGQDVEKIDSIMRFAFMLPLHDVTREKDLVRERMRAIEAAMKTLGAAASGPGEYALGRGRLALKEYERARRHLESAWAAGYRAPEVSYARGLALGAIYQQELERAEKVLDKQQREERIRKIEKELLAPALQSLQEARPARTDSPEYAGALMAYQGKKYAEALRLAQNAFQHLPWLYEAIRLEGDVHLRLAKEERDRGNFDGARKQFRAADAEYRSAVQMAQSDPETYDRLCGMWLTAMAMEIYYAGGDPEEGFSHVIDAAEKSLKSDPRHALPLVRKAQALSVIAEYRSGRGEDTSTVERQAFEAADAAVAMDPAGADSYISRASAYQQQAATQALRGEDPRPALEHAEADFLKSISIRSDDAIYNDLGFTYWTAADYEIERGVDPTRNLERSIEAYQSSLKIQPGNPITYNNLGIALDTKGLHELQQGRDPASTLQLALKNYAKAVELSPRWPLPLSNQGNAYLYLADFQQRQGVDPMANIEKSIECFEKAIAINPNRPNFHSNVAGSAAAAAIYFIRRGKDPGAWLNRAETAAQKALEINDSDYYFFLQQAQVESLRARWALRQKKDPSAFIARSATKLAEAAKRNPEDPDIFATSAENALFAAVWSRSRGEAIRTESGIRDAKRALSLHPDHAGAMAVQAALISLQSGGKRGSDLMARALKLDPSLKADFDW